jgi:hypothetical protein
MHGLILLAQIPFVLRIPELLAEPWFKYLLLPVCGLLAGADRSVRYVNLVASRQ